MIFKQKPFCIMQYFIKLFTFPFKMSKVLKMISHITYRSSHMIFQVFSWQFFSNMNLFRLASFQFNIYDNKITAASKIVAYNKICNTLSYFRQFMKEVARLEELKRQHMQKFIDSIRKELQALWDKCYLGEEQRQLFRAFYSGKHLT